MSKFSIIVNLDVPYGKAPKFPYKERITHVDGITTIRPLRNGVPGGTEQEVSDAIAEFERAMAESKRERHVKCLEDIGLLIAEDTGCLDLMPPDLTIDLQSEVLNQF